MSGTDDNSEQQQLVHYLLIPKQNVDVKNMTTPSRSFLEHWDSVENAFGIQLHGRHLNGYQTANGKPVMILYSVDPAGYPTPVCGVQVSSNSEVYSVLRSELPPYEQLTDDVYSMFSYSGAQISFILTNFTTNGQYLKLDILKNKNEPKDITDYKEAGPGINCVNEIRPLECYEAKADQTAGSRAMLIFPAKSSASSAAPVTMKTYADTDEKDRAALTRDEVTAFYITVTPINSSEEQKKLFQPPNTLVWKSSDKVMIPARVFYEQCAVMGGGGFAMGASRGGDRGWETHQADRNGMIPECASYSDASYRGGGERVAKGGFGGGDRGGVQSKGLSDTSSRGGGGDLQLCSAGAMSDEDEDGDAEFEGLESAADCVRGDKPKEGPGVLTSHVATLRHGAPINPRLGNTTYAQYAHELRTPALSIRPLIVPEDEWHWENPERVYGRPTYTREDFEVAAAKTESLIYKWAADRAAGGQAFTAEECVVCLEDKNDALLLDCMHNCMHRDCAKDLVAANTPGSKNCPICRRRVLGWISFTALTSQA